MRIWTMMLVLVAASTTATASDYYRCEIDGRTVYRGIPCPGDVITQAPAAPPASTPGSWEETCEKTAGLAGQIMDGRQNGAPMSRMMAISDLALIKEMVVEAYETPRYSTTDYQQQAIADFTDEHYLTCIKARP